MPIESGGTWYAVPDDFITTTPPTSTTQFWPFARFTGPRVLWGSGANIIIGESISLFPDRDMAWPQEVFYTAPSLAGSLFSNAFYRQYQSTSEATNKATMDSLISAAIPGATYTWGTAEQQGSIFISYPSGIVQYTQFIDTFSGGNDAEAISYRSHIATLTNPTYNEWTLKANWDTLAAEYVADKVSNNNWRWIVPQATWPTVRPMTYLPDGSYGSRSEAYPSGSGESWIALDPRHFRFVRTAANKMVWAKNLDWTDVRSDTGDNNKAKYPGIGFDYSSFFGGPGVNVTVAARNADAKYTQQWLHFATVDGADSPTSRAEAQTMIGVDLAGDWQVGGLDGLHSYAAFPWYGKFESYPTQPTWQNKSLRVTHILGEASVSATSITSLEEFLSREGVALASQWELYPESDVGPSVDNVQEPTLELLVEAPPTVKLKLDTLVAPDGGAP